MPTITIHTPPCMECGKTSQVEVDADRYKEWKEEGVLIQRAFPEMPADQRELLITGTHPACWDAMMADIEEGE